LITELYEVIAVGVGHLYVMPRPRADVLKDELKNLCSRGINIVVSHLEKSEEIELGLTQEEAILNELGIRFVSYPIKDRSLPECADYTDFIDQIYEQLQGGKNVVVHCMAGIGRTGMTSSCLLVRDGYEAPVAMDMVSAARGAKIPDTMEQYDFICDYFEENQ